MLRYLTVALLLISATAFAYDMGPGNDMADAIESVSGPVSGSPGNDPYDMPPSPLGDLYDIASGPAPAPSTMADFFQQLQAVVDAWNAYFAGTGPFPSYSPPASPTPPKKITFYATAVSKRGCAHFLAMNPVKRCTKLSPNKYRLKVSGYVYQTTYGAAASIQGE